MSSKLKIIGYTVLILFITVSLSHIYDYVSYSLSSYTSAIDNIVTIDTLDEGDLYYVEDLSYEKDNIDITFKTDKEVMLVINYLPYLHRIYIGDELISQNIDRSIGGFDQNFSYKVFTLEGNTNLLLTGDRVKGSRFFYADKKTMNTYLHVRTFFYSMYILGFIIIGTVNFVMFFRNRNKYHFLVMGIMGVIVLVKIYLKGDLFFLLSIFNINIETRNQLHAFIGIIWLYCPILATTLFYRMPFTRIYKALIIISFTIIMGVSIFGDYSFNHDLIIYSIVPVYIYVVYYLVSYNKKIDFPIVLATILMSSSSYYMGGSSAGMFSYGVTNFVSYISATGLFCFMSIYLGLFVHEHFESIEQLKLKEARYERVKLLQGIGHDLKMPISVIKSSNQIIKKYSMSDEDRQEYLSTGLEAVNELELMAKNISAYISDNESIAIPQQSISLRDSFAKLKKQLSIYTKNENYDFTIITPDQDTDINISYSDFYRLVFNLISNAFKYTPEGGVITLSYDIGDKVSISVRDTGIGMLPEEVDRIFTPFYRADLARSKDGIGIGLSVVKSICDNNDIEIIVDSEIDKGTNITLNFNK